MKARLPKRLFAGVIDPTNSGINAVLRTPHFILSSLLIIDIPKMSKIKTMLTPDQKKSCLRRVKKKAISPKKTPRTRNERSRVSLAISKIEYGNKSYLKLKCSKNKAVQKRLELLSLSRKRSLEKVGKQKKFLSLILHEVVEIKF
ncbi:MAG: hypothetical protein V5A76_03265 [Candidatus Thermoplasmatota archaeon]